MSDARAPRERPGGAWKSVWIAALALTAALDQVTKSAMHAARALGESSQVLPVLNWLHAHNPGAAFSFLASEGGWQRPALTVLALGVAAGILLSLAFFRHGRVAGTALALIAGGALGNGLDRLRRGHVEDFIDLYVGTWHWPAFNLADMWIVSGIATLLLVDVLSRRRQLR